MSMGKNPPKPSAPAQRIVNQVNSGVPFTGPRASTAEKGKLVNGVFQNRNEQTLGSSGNDKGVFGTTVARSSILANDASAGDTLGSSGFDKDFKRKQTLGVL